MYFVSPAQTLKDKKKHLLREKSIRNHASLINSENQGDVSILNDQELSKISERKTSPKNDFKILAQENRPINLIPSTSKNEKLKIGPPINPERLSINVNSSVQNSDHSMILRDSYNKIGTKRSRVTTLLVDKAKERNLAGNNKLKPITNKKESQDKFSDRNCISKPSSKTPDLVFHSNTNKYQNSKTISANRADIILQRNQELVKKQNDSIARALREIGSFDKSTFDLKSKEPTIPKKRESALIRDSFLSKELSMIEQNERDSPYNSNNNKQLKRQLPKELLKKHFRHSSVPRKSSLERIKKDLEMPSRNEFSTRSMFNDLKDHNTLANEESKIFNRNRVLSSRTRDHREKHQMDEVINNSVRQIKREILLDDEIFERFNQRSLRNRHSSLNHESLNDVDKEIEKVEVLYHKNENAYAHLLSIRGRLMDLYLANDFALNKKIKGRSAQP